MALLKKTGRPIYVDIDGTLTDAPTRPWGQVNAQRIAAVRDLIERGYQVVLWSGGGTKYASEFAAKHGIKATACLGKPEACIDDNPDIRPRDRMKVHGPDVLDRSN